MSSGPHGAPTLLGTLTSISSMCIIAICNTSNLYDTCFLNDHDIQLNLSESTTPGIGFPAHDKWAAMRR